ncbi:MAG: aspartate aminotransferase family protein [Cytophagales bacterium]|nr:MAG: aspartate aminotransferase family protein [Cytophagales bacterium]
MTQPFPEQGLSAKDIVERLNALKINDIDWKSGRVFAYVYDAGEESQDLLRQAHNLFLSENALDPTVFPSLLHLENEVIAWAADLVGGNAETVGNFTTGGTESIFLALKTARDFAKATRQIQTPEVILPHTAHAAFHKACAFLGIKPIVIAVDKTSFCAVPAWIEEAITPNTILLVASAPSYAHGVIDPIEEIAKIAQKHNLLFHVDACVGGMYLPFAKEVGYQIPSFDFSVEGVTSLSMDFHKFGYAAKGASAVLYKNAHLRQYQLFVSSSWAGYTMINTTLLSTKSGGSLAACWAILNFLGKEGYRQRVQMTMEATQRMIDYAKDSDYFYLLGKPAMNLVAFASDKVNLFELADLMRLKGWYLQPQLQSTTSPENLHFSISPSNVPQITFLLEDLDTACRELLARPSALKAQVSAILTSLQSSKQPSIADITTLLGMKEGNLPTEMALINALLNELPVPMREYLLKAFVNELFK